MRGCKPDAAQETTACEFTTAHPFKSEKIMIELLETPAQLDADRINENASRMLNALLLIVSATPAGNPAHDIAAAAIEDATGAHDPECYAGTGLAEKGYDVDAAGTPLG